MLMVVRNNYYWLDEKSKAGFIANGDIVEVIRVRETIEIYGFRFARVVVQLVDYPDEKDLDVIVMLDTLSSETPSLSYDDYKKLHAEVGLDYVGDREANKKIKENEILRHRKKIKKLSDRRLYWTDSPDKFKILFEAL